MTVLRNEYTNLRNYFHQAKRHNLSKKILSATETQAWAAKHTYFKALKKRKKEHWEEFLDSTESIWQTTKYLSDQAVKPSFSAISKIRDSSSSEVTTSNDIANALLDNFFPPHPPRVLPASNSSVSKTPYTTQLSSISLTLVEVHTAIFKASPLKGPGDDGIPALVWQNLWPGL